MLIPDDFVGHKGKLLDLNSVLENKVNQIILEESKCELCDSNV